MTMSKIAAVGLAGLLSASVLPVTASCAFSPVSHLRGVVTSIDKAERTITVGRRVIHYVRRDAISDLDYARPSHFRHGRIERTLHVGDVVNLSYFLRDGEPTLTRITLD